MHNASTLGPLPLRPLRELTGDDLVATWSVNAVAPHELTRALLPRLRASAASLIALSSDAAVEHYPTWGAYGAGKAALDHLTADLGAEEGLLAYAIDPGDMRTAHAPGGLPGRGHLRSAAAGHGGAGLPGAAPATSRRRAATAPPTSLPVGV